MKKLLLILSLFALLLSCAKDEGMGVENQPLPEEFTYKVSVDQALKNLDIALANIDGETRSAKRSVKSIERVKASQVMDLTRSADIPQLEDLLYVVSFGEGQGSAVLGADKRVSPVLAIFDETVFEAEDFNRPETRSEIADEGEVRDVETEEELEEFVAGMITAGAVSELSSRAGGDFGEEPWTPITLIRRDTVVQPLYVKAPMLETKWHQDSPYNDYCPAYNDGQHKAVGCAIIAAAQFLKHYQLPNPNIVNNESFLWSLINQDCYGNTPSLMAQREVASFVYNLGVAMGAEYDNVEQYGTDADLGELVGFLADIGFNYTATYTNLMTLNYTTARNIVMNKGPFCMRGSNSSLDGHAWVVDGWNEYKTIIKDVYYQAITGTILNEEILSTVTATLMHCNMGWGGKCDGYYSGVITGFNATVQLDEEYVDTNIGDYQGTNANSNFTHTFKMVQY